MHSSAAESSTNVRGQWNLNWFLRKKPRRLHIKSKHYTYLYPISNDPETSLNLFFFTVSICIHIYQLRSSTSQACEGGRVAIIFLILHMNELRFREIKCLNQSCRLTMQSPLWSSGFYCAESGKLDRKE